MDNGTLAKIGFDAHVANVTDGFAGRIIVVWKNDSIQVDVCVIDDQFFALKSFKEQGSGMVLHSHSC